MVNEPYRFERVIKDDTLIGDMANLLSVVFPNTVRYTREYLHWQYFENPHGEVVGYNAYDASDELAAHYVVQPLKARLFGRVARGALSLNTATHANHQGKGLFVKLARLTYKTAAELGYEFVVGVANANSTPGFIRKLNFQLVAPLDARLGVGRPTASSDVGLDYQRLWDEGAREWRMRRPFEHYWVNDGQPFAHAEQAGFRVCLSATEGWPNTSSRHRFAPLTVWLGLNPHAKWRGVSTSIPVRLRPSPLNFIYLSLSDESPTLNPANIAVEPIDFDAY